MTMQQALIVQWGKLFLFFFFLGADDVQLVQLFLCPTKSSILRGAPII